MSPGPGLTPGQHPLRVAGLSGRALEPCLSWEVDESALWVPHDLRSTTSRNHGEVGGTSTLSWGQLSIACCPGGGQCLTHGESTRASEGAGRVGHTARLCQSGRVWPLVGPGVRGWERSADGGPFGRLLCLERLPQPRAGSWFSSVNETTVSELRSQRRRGLREALGSDPASERAG